MSKITFYIYIYNIYIIETVSIKETQDVMSIVGREIQLTKDYTTGNATFKRGSRGTVIDAPSHKDGKLKVKWDNDNTKTFRLIKQCDLQLYEGVALSSNSESQTIFFIFYVCQN